MAKTTLRTLFGATLMALATLVQAQEPRVVAITQIVEHPALDAVYQGIKDELAERGFKEGENLEVASVGSGTHRVQTGQLGWSGNAQLWWRNADTGAELSTQFVLEEGGRYQVEAELTKAADYGIVQLSINGTRALARFNGYHKDGVATEQVNLGTHHLKAGESTLSVKVLGKDERAKPGNMAGIDVLHFEKAK